MRYKTSNPSIGEAGQESGDEPFAGIDEKTLDPGLMKPGTYRKGLNVRILNGNLATRGGLTKASSFNPVSYGKIYGRGYFVDPQTNISWLLVATSSQVWAVAYGYNPKSILYPPTIILQGPVDLVSAYGVVILFFGPGITELFWDGTWGQPFGELPGPIPGYVSIPPAETAEFISDRIVVPYKVDSLAVSNIGDFTSFSTFFNNFNINQGEGDLLVRCMEWNRGTALFFKSRSIYLAENFFGDLSQMILNRVTKGRGLVGRRAAVLVGNDFFFVSPGEICRMKQIFQDSPEVLALPISEPIYNTMKDINWAAGDKIIAQCRKDRVYFAVPMGTEKRNNVLLVYNIVNEGWESIDIFTNNPSYTVGGGIILGPVVHIDDIVEMPYNGERRLFAIDYLVGAIYLMEDESSVDYFSTAAGGGSQIYTHFLSRGYAGGSLYSNYRHLRLGLATWHPNFSVNCYSSGIGAKQSLAKNITKPKTKYYGFGIPDWDTTNSKDDWGNRGRKDYSVTLPIRIGSGIYLDLKQDFIESYAIRSPGKYAQIEVINTQGAIEIREIDFESWEVQRGDRVV